MKKRKLKRKAKIILSLIVVVILALLCATIYIKYENYQKELKIKEINKEKERKKKEEEKLKPKKYSFKMIMVGDALIHNGVYMDAKEADGTYNFKKMLIHVKPIVKTYDIAYYNQETILGGTGLGLSSYPRFNSPQEVGDAFIDAGFNMVSLATNHTMDMGEKGVEASVAYWKTHPEVVSSGQWTSEEERNKVRIYEKNGIKYAFFSYTIWDNGLKTPEDKEYLNNMYSNEKAEKDISSVKDKVDAIIVAMHWGTEYSYGIDSKQVEIANYLSSLGVNLIIGCHPHVVEPVEYINDNKTYVIYSLGNFISDQEGVGKNTGLMMEVTVNKVYDPKTKEIKVTVDNPKAELVYTSANRKPVFHKNFSLYSYKDLNNDILPDYQTYYEKYKEIVSSRQNDLVWGLSGEE